MLLTIKTTRLHQSPKAQYLPAEVEVGIDWISALPDSLILQILSKIPITYACTSTILSKRWQNLWTCIHDRYHSNNGWSDNGFISFIDYALPLLTSSKIKKFTLQFTPNLAPSNYSSKLNKWLQIVLKKKVEHLHLDLWYCHAFLYLYLDSDRYSLPQDLCSSSSLLKLKCRCCRIPEDRMLNWTSLTSLTLTIMLLSEEHMEQITSNCHQLESLKLSGFCGFHRLYLTSPKCRRLELIDHMHPVDYMGGDCYFEIVAPYVQHLKISGCFVGVEIRLGDLSSLIHADLTYKLYDFRVSGEVIDKSIVKDHLTSVACLNELIISSLYVKMISMLILQKEDVSLPLLECKQLTINSWISKYTFLGIDRLLSSIPCLENLTIHLKEMIFMLILQKEDVPFLLLECKRLTINSWTSKYTFFGIDRLLSSTPCLENLTIHLKKDSTFLNYWCEDMDMLEDNYENIFEGSLRNLKILKVILQWSLFIEDRTTEQTEVMKYLLERAKNLEKLVIVPTNNGCSKMIKSLLALPIVSCHDPKFTSRDGTYVPNQ